MNNRIGLFGGTFDPVHYGHLLLAESAREQLELDAVWWIPAALSPFKRDRSPASNADRLEMLRLATAGHPAFAVNPIELERGGVSYTSDTIRTLAQQYPDHSWFLLMGADSLDGFPDWHQPEAILQRATLAIVHRPGCPAADLRSLQSLAQHHQLEAVRVCNVEMPLVDLSSTDIRRRVKTGRSIRYRTPRAVEEYIHHHGLYRSDGDADRQ